MFNHKMETLMTELSEATEVEGFNCFRTNYKREYEFGKSEAIESILVKGNNVNSSDNNKSICSLMCSPSNIQSQ